VDIFQGQIKSKVTCLSCNTRSETFDPLMYLSIPFPEKIKKDQKFKIQDLFKAYIKEEKIDCKWDCGNCKQKSSINKKIDIWKAPNILIIHLKRFKYNSKSGFVKINNLVEFPVRNFDLSEFVLSFQRTKPEYNLFACCVSGDHFKK
jgi:ubiquitin carboxyl-terminal hydrolase 8